MCIHGHMHVMFNLAFEILMKFVVSLEICLCVTVFLKCYVRVMLWYEM